MDERVHVVPPSSYTERLRNFSRNTAAGSPFRPLANFLSSGHARLEEHVEYADVRCLAWFGAVHPEQSLEMQPVLSLSGFHQQDRLAVDSGCAGRVIMLRGFPSLRWIDFLGDMFDVNPEFWRRHLGCIVQAPADDLAKPASLPSTTDRILQHRVASIGSRKRFWQPHVQDLQVLRYEATKKFQAYRANLEKWDTAKWTPGDSVVRQYVLHDKEHFTIDQNVTAYLHAPEAGAPWAGTSSRTLDTSREQSCLCMELNVYAVIVLVDCADDLSSSPHGPWLNDDGSPNCTMLPPPVDDEETMTQFRYQGKRTSSRHSAADGEFVQSLSNLHISLGARLDAETRAQVPFYVLHDVFRTSILVDSQLLNLISHKTGSEDVDIVNSQTGTASYETEQLQLLHFQRFLESRLHAMQDLQSLFQRQRAGMWPGASVKRCRDISDMSLSSLQQDHDHLMNRTRDLLTRVERSINLLTSLIQIQQAKRSHRLNQTLFRFTLVAAVYIPLSFTTSFFGMNFVQFGTGTLNLWIFFVVGVPVFVASAAALLWH
jgi:hypothetical protein